MIELLMIDVEAPRPEVTQIESVWRDDSADCTGKVGDALGDIEARLVARLSGTGKAITVECTLPDNKALHWFMHRDRLGEIDFFYEIFSSKGFQSALGTEQTLKPAPSNRQFELPRQRSIAESSFISTSGVVVKEDRLGFEQTSCLTQTGMLASDIFFAAPGSDEAPGKSPDNGREILHAAVTASDAMLASGYGNSLCYHSAIAWAPWFANIEWDRTYVYIDKARAKVSFIMITDTQ